MTLLLNKYGGVSSVVQDAYRDYIANHLNSGPTRILVHSCDCSELNVNSGRLLDVLVKCPVSLTYRYIFLELLPY